MKLIRIEILTVSENNISEIDYENLGIERPHEEEIKKIVYINPKHIVSLCENDTNSKTIIHCVDGGWWETYTPLDKLAKMFGFGL